MTPSIAKWTLNDYHQMIDAGILDHRQVELLRGEIVEMSPEGTPHANKSTQAGEYLMRLLGDAAQVRSAKPITLPNGSEPEPDLAIVQRLPDEYDRHHPYPNQIFWVIEYSNTSLSIDLGIKAEVYAEAGLQEYWVANLKERALIILRDPIAGRYQSQQTVQQGTLTPLAFPAIALSVDRLL